MNGYEWVVAGAAWLGLFGGMMRFMWSQFNRMRTNDLRHIEERLERIENKQDEHLAWHLRHYGH